MRSAKFALLLIPILTAIGFCCRTVPPARTVLLDSQRIDLSPQLHGSLVFEDEDGAIKFLDLTSLKNKVIRQSKGHGPPHAFIRSVAGPSRDGRIAFVEGEMDAKVHRLKLINQDGSGEGLLFERSGDPIWDHVISDALAMSGDGQVAFIAKLHGVQFPRALVQEGTLQICDAGTRSVRNVAPAAIDMGISWFPDGKRIAFVAAAPVAKIPSTVGLNDDWAIAPSDDSGLKPAVFVLDLATGQSSVVSGGWMPVVATDGKSILVCDMAQELQSSNVEHWRRIWLASAKVEAVHVPALIGPFIALYGDGTAIYQGQQTEGSPTFTKFYSPLAGERQLLSIKGAMLGTNQFQTLLPEFDFRSSISFSPQ